MGPIVQLNKGADPFDDHEEDNAEEATKVRNLGNVKYMDELLTTALLYQFQLQFQLDGFAQQSTSKFFKEMPGPPKKKETCV